MTHNDIQVKLPYKEVQIIVFEYVMCVNLTS